MKLEKKPKWRSMNAITTELWALARRISFRTHANPLGGVDFYTCPQRGLVGQNRQCGHAYPAGALGASMKYDLHILRPQCYNCNINYGGMSVVFWKNLERELGKKAAGVLYRECQSSKGYPVNARNHYTNLIREYSLILTSYGNIRL